MSKRFEIAIIGADSPVAEALMELMTERGFPVAETSALVLDPASEADVSFAGRPILLDDARSFDFSQRSEEHTSELQSLMRISYAVFCLKNKNILNRS